MGNDNNDNNENTGASYDIRPALEAAYNQTYPANADDSFFDEDNSHIPTLANETTNASQENQLVLHQPVKFYSRGYSGTGLLIRNNQ